MKPPLRLILGALLCAALGVAAVVYRDEWVVVADTPSEDPAQYGRDGGTPLLQQHYGPHAHNGE